MTDPLGSSSACELEETRVHVAESVGTERGGHFAFINTTTATVFEGPREGMDRPVSVSLGFACLNPPTTNPLLSLGRRKINLTLLPLGNY